jgi:hypothetical protein
MSFRKQNSAPTSMEIKLPCLQESFKDSAKKLKSKNKMDNKLWPLEGWLDASS